MEAAKRIDIPLNVEHHAKADEMEKRGRTISRAIVFGPVMKKNITTGESKAMPADEALEGLAIQGRIIEPPFDQLVLAMLPEHSATMGPCVEAMEINVDGFGYALDSRVKLDAPNVPDTLKAEVKGEKVRLTNWFNKCCVKESFTAMRRRTRKDLETTGNAYWEVIRSPLSREIQALSLIPSFQMRIGVEDDCFTDYTRNVLTLQEDDSVTLEKDTVPYRFRRYVQSRLGGITRAFAPGHGATNVRWFKEFGDPRIVDNRTGEVLDGPKANLLPEQHRANEIVHFKIYSSRTPYGLPRYIGQLLSIFGDRASEEVNFITLKNNNIPSMVFMVSNGQLTEGTISRITEFADSQMQGSENMSKFLIVEAEGQFEGTDGSQVKLDIKPLTDQQMRDQMFLEYQKQNAEKIRRAWRLPPIFIGATTDYNKATAEDLISVLMAAERTGALSPTIARDILADVLNRPLPDINPEYLDPNVPFSIQMAQAVKNLAAQQTGSPEVGSQVTALKDAHVEDLATEIIIQKARMMGADALAEAFEFNRDILQAELAKRLKA
jgi:capsid portal protein